jgi:pimeloyl-ACP methyl ester carboxylesterase
LPPPSLPRKRGRNKFSPHVWGELEGGEIALMPFPYFHEKKKISDALRKSVRQSSGSDFISLPSGYTHYEMSNPDATETVVLVHGFTVPMFIWEPTFQFLSKQGYRVLRYDLFGRGYSDRPKAKYDLDFFATQLRDLLDALNINEPVNLFGLSMGGAITATFTARYPERVKKLALFDPAGGADLPRSLILKMMEIPLLGELLMGFFGRRTLTKGLAADFHNPELLEHFTSQYLPQLDYQGFLRAILMTLRNDALRNSLPTYRKVGELGIPKLLVWGRDDQTVPYDQAEAVVASLPGVRFHTIEDSGHIPHYEDADQANPIILDFLKN